ncbi:MAG: hypothetical protein ACR2MP_24165 [Streptosporangiaceae bacterium]
MYETFRALYPATREHVHKLATMQESAAQAERDQAIAPDAAPRRAD